MEELLFAKPTVKTEATDEVLFARPVVGKNVEKAEDVLFSKPQVNSQPKTNTKYDGSWDSFKKVASEIAGQENYPVNVLLGQAALETARGTSTFAKQRNNYFGMKAYDSNPDNATKYNSPEQSIKDYINLIKNTPRYAGAYQQYLKDKNSLKLLQGIRAAGYATDPNYVKKVASMPEFGGTQ